MSRVRQRLLIALGGLLALLLLAALGLAWLLDPEGLRPQLVAGVREATGRELRLDGPLELEWFPWLALRVGQGELANPPGVEGPPLLRWREARLRARTLSLLRGELRLGRVSVDGARLSLHRDSAGRANWEGLGSARGAAAADSRASRLLQGLRLEGFDLRDAALEYRDESAPQSRLGLDALQLRGGPWRPGAPLEVELECRVSRGGAPLLEIARLALRVQPGPGGALALSDLGLRGRLSARPAELTLDAARLQLDVGRGRFSAPLLQAGLGPARLTLRELLLESPPGAPLRAAANFELAPVAAREWLVSLGIEAPQTRDPRVLGALAAQGRLAWDGSVLRVAPLALSLDETRLAGQLSWGPRIEFALEGSAMDLDRYREPEEAVSEAFVFPGAQLAKLQARGTLALERARFEGVDLEGVSLRLLLDEGGASGATGVRP